jgi:NitT/TauT family transport system permease protein
MESYIENAHTYNKPNKKGLPIWAWNLISLVVFALIWIVIVDLLKLYKPFQIPPLLGENSISQEIDFGFFKSPPEGGAMLNALINSLKRIAVGFSAAIGIGFVVGMILSTSSILRGIIGAWLTGIQSVPSIAFVPLALIWFGLNEKAVLFVVILEGFIPVALAISSSIINVAPTLRTAGRTLGASGLALYLRVLLPASLPNLTSALRTAWSFAWRALIGAELLASSGGLGKMLETGRNTSSIALVMTTILLIGFLGIVMDTVMRAWETTIRRNYGLEVNS